MKRCACCLQDVDETELTVEGRYWFCVEQRDCIRRSLAALRARRAALPSIDD